MSEKRHQPDNPVLRPVWNWIAGGERPDNAECVREIQRCLWEYHEQRGCGLDMLAWSHLDDVIVPTVFVVEGFDGDSPLAKQDFEWVG